MENPTTEHTQKEKDNESKENTSISQDRYQKLADDLLKNEEKGKKQIEILQKFSPVPFAEQIIRDYDRNIFSDTEGTIWGYSHLKGFWEDVELVVMASLRNNYFNDSQQQNHYVAEIISYLRQALYEEGRNKKPGWKYINLANGIFDMEKEDLLPHSPSFFFTNRIELGVDENIKECPKIHKLFSDWVDKEDIITLYEMVAYSLVDNYKYQKMFFIVGKGYNGKGKFAEIIQKTVGQENVIGISLDGLVEREFEKIRLQNKKVNIAGEINVKELKKTDTIKMLTGGDTITARRLYHMGVEFVNTCKLVFLTNSPPMTKDKTKGFYRRVFVQMFTRDFEGSDNPNIIDELEIEEFQGLLSVCLYKILPALIKRKFKFTRDKNTEEMEEIYERLSNPLSNFIYEKFVETSDGFIPIKVFKTLFKTWCQENGDNIWSDKKLGSTMKNTLGFSVGKRNIPEGSREYLNNILGTEFYEAGTEIRQESYLGISLKNIKVSDGSDGRGFSESLLYVRNTSSKTSDTSDTSDSGPGRKKQKEEIKNTTSDIISKKQKENTNSNSEKSKEENKDAREEKGKKPLTTLTTGNNEEKTQEEVRENENKNLCDKKDKSNSILRHLGIAPGVEKKIDFHELLERYKNNGFSEGEALTLIGEAGGIITKLNGNIVFDFSFSLNVSGDFIRKKEV